MFTTLGPLLYRHRWTVIGAWALLWAVSLGLLLRGGAMTTGHIRNLEAERAEAAVTRVTGHPPGNTFVVIFQSDTLDPEDTPFGDAMNRALAPLRSDPRVAAIQTLDSAPAAIAMALENPAQHAALALVTVAGTEKQALAAYPALRAKLHSSTLRVTCTGKLPFTHDLDHTLEVDLLRAELLSMPLALLVLLWVFRTLVAALLPVLVGGLAVVGGIGVVTALSRSMDIAQYTVNVCSLIGLGVAIDYSLFMVSRYREELQRGRSFDAALAETVRTAGKVVAFSGAAVGTGLCGLLFFSHSYLSAMGLGGAIVMALAALAALTFLPALFAVLGPRIHALRLPGLARRNPGPSAFWHPVAMWVMQRPVWVLVPTLAALLCMGIPFLHLRMARADVRVLEPSVEARAGYDLLSRDFPALAGTRHVIAVKFPGPALTAARVGAAWDLSRRIAKIPGVRTVQSLVDDPNHPDMSRAAFQDLLIHPPPMFAKQLAEAEALTVKGGELLMYVTQDAPSESEAARAVVRAIRADRAVGDGALEVGGETAQDVDATAFILSRAPRAVALVVSVSLVVLFLLLGSVLLPIKAVLMNVVSIAGSFGALVWVFQEGHLFVQHPRPIEPSLPVLLFCVIFGLSMDYEVLMLSRMKEAYAERGDNTAAVALGLERSAGLITSAAAIMVAVFGAFALARVVVVQAVGFGMALAVALDATLVRVLLVPATMRLLGRANWWAPRALLSLRAALGGSPSPNEKAPPPAD